MRPWRSVRYRVNRKLDERSPMRAARRVGADVGVGVELPRGTKLTSVVSIGDHTWFASAPTFTGAGHIRIGRWNAIGEGLHFISQNHDPSFANMHFALYDACGLHRAAVVKGVEVGNSCWIGTNAILLAGSTIGDGAVVGAGSVVVGELPPFSICVGVPARPIRQRFSPETVDLLLELKWWDWPMERIQRNQEFFAMDLTNATGPSVRAVIRQ